MLIGSKKKSKRLQAKDEVLFNAGVWSGTKAKELGLIDSIGDYYNVMKIFLAMKLNLEISLKNNHGLNKSFYLTVMILMLII